MQLQGRVDDALGGFRRMQLGHRRLAADAGRAHVLGPGSAVDQQRRSIHLQRHIRDMPLHHLQLGQRRAEKLALAHAGQRLVQRPAGKAQRRCTDGGAEHVQHRHGDLEAIAALADQCRLRQADTVETQMRQRMGRDHLDALDDLQPRRVRRQQEGGKALGSRRFARAGKHDIKVSDAAVGNVGLLTGQDKAARHGLCRCGAVGHIRTGARLRQGKGADRGAGTGALQPCALLRRAEQRDGPHAQPLHGKGKIGKTIMPGQRFADEAEAAHVQRLALASTRVAQPTGLPQIAHQRTAGLVRVGVIDMKMGGAPGIQRLGQFAVAGLEEGPGEERAVCHFSCPRKPASAWRRRHDRRGQNPASACRSPVPALPPRWPAPAPCSIPGSAGSW